MRGLLLIALMLPALALSQDYRCKDEKGEYWSTRPCPAGEEFPEPRAVPRDDWDAAEFVEAHRTRAMVACYRAIEDLARINYRWTASSWTGSRYRRVVAADQETLLLVGDEIELQNGFGAYIRHLYACFYTPATDRAEATAEPGRL